MDYCSNVDHDMQSNSDHNNSGTNPNNEEGIYHPVVAGILSIVLSHHFQKQEIIRLIEDTTVDFGIVRDTMYKYSKKAEDKFFSNPVFALLFTFFALSDQGIKYTKAKLLSRQQNENIKPQNNAEVGQGRKTQQQNNSKQNIINKDPEINQPKLEGQRTGTSHQAQMSKRIINETQGMCMEAAKYLNQVEWHAQEWGGEWVIKWVFEQWKKQEACQVFQDTESIQDEQSPAKLQSSSDSSLSKPQGLKIEMVKEPSSSIEKTESLQSRPSTELLKDAQRGEDQDKKVNKLSEVIRHSTTQSLSKQASNFFSNHQNVIEQRNIFQIPQPILPNSDSLYRFSTPLDVNPLICLNRANSYQDWNKKIDNKSDIMSRLKHIAHMQKNPSVSSINSPVNPLLINRLSYNSHNLSNRGSNSPSPMLRKECNLSIQPQTTSLQQNGAILIPKPQKPLQINQMAIGNDQPKLATPCFNDYNLQSNQRIMDSLKELAEGQ